MQQALAAGVKFFQYRNKRVTRKSIYENSLQLALLARESGALFIVNDHADIAAAVDADGVHLGQDDLPIEYARKLLDKDKLIGISTHNVEQAKTAEGMGADYIGFGPIFRTSTKDAGQTQGIQNLTIVKNAVSIPVIAIGGINQANVQFVSQAGAAGAAMISAILSSENITYASRQILGLLTEGRGK